MKSLSRTPCRSLPDTRRRAPNERPTDSTDTNTQVNTEGVDASSTDKARGWGAGAKIPSLQNILSFTTALVSVTDMGKVYNLTGFEACWVRGSQGGKRIYPAPLCNLLPCTPRAPDRRPRGSPSGSIYNGIVPCFVCLLSHSNFQMRFQVVVYPFVYALVPMFGLFPVFVYYK